MGARPVWHLAALVVLGDLEKLKFYQASFEAGDRLGFVKYITKNYIDSAVASVVRISAAHSEERCQGRTGKNGVEERCQSHLPIDACPRSIRETVSESLK